MHSDELANSEYNPSHPFKPVRAKILLELLNRYSLIYKKNQKITEPNPLREEILYLFHDKNYIDLLKKGEKGEFTIEMLHAGIGTGDNPLFKSMYQLSLLVEQF